MNKAEELADLQERCAESWLDGSEPQKIRLEIAAELRRLDAENHAIRAVNAELMDVAKLLALATDEGDDAAQGTHYVDKVGVIRCKGSFLATIEKSRAAIASARKQENPHG